MPPQITAGLAHQRWLPLFGLPLTVSTNSGALSSSLEDERPLGGWARLPAELIESAMPTLQIDVLLGEAAEHAGAMRLFRHGETVLAGDGPRLLMAQPARGYALACLPPAPLGAAVAAIWELGILLARPRGRAPIRAAAIARDGRAVLLIGAGCDALIANCLGRGFRPLAQSMVHISDSAGGLRVWGDGVGGDLLSCPGPATACLIERAAGRSSQIMPRPVTEMGDLGAAAAGVRAAYTLRVGGDLETAAALIEHVA
jgi:hypothetical protein